MKKPKIDRKHCNKMTDCWQYDYMVDLEFTIEEMIKVCRKCIFFNNKKGSKR